MLSWALRDLAMPIIAFGLLASAIIAGCIKIFSVRSLQAPALACIPCRWPGWLCVEHGLSGHSCQTPRAAAPHEHLGACGWQARL